MVGQRVQLIVVMRDPLHLLRVLIPTVCPTSASEGLGPSSSCSCSCGASCLWVMWILKPGFTGILIAMYRAETEKQRERERVVRYEKESSTFHVPPRTESLIPFTALLLLCRPIREWPAIMKTIKNANITTWRPLRLTPATHSP
jgi:hypothetical protein